MRGRPLTPDADEARAWAREELAKDDYTQGGDSWVTRLKDWWEHLLDSLGRGLGDAAGPWGVLAIIVVILAVGGLAVWLLVGPMRRARRRATVTGVLDDDRDAQSLADAAAAAAAAGDWTRATIEAFRATVRVLGDREVIDVIPGLTADEAAAAAGSARASLRQPMSVDAEVFDGLRYGQVVATRAHYEHARATWTQANETYALAESS